MVVKRMILGFLVLFLVGCFLVTNYFSSQNQKAQLCSVGLSASQCFAKLNSDFRAYDSNSNPLKVRVYKGEPVWTTDTAVVYEGDRIVELYNLDIQSQRTHFVEEHGLGWE